MALEKRYLEKTNGCSWRLIAVISIAVALITVLSDALGILQVLEGKISLLRINTLSLVINWTEIEEKV